MDGKILRSQHVRDTLPWESTSKSVEGRCLSFLPLQPSFSWLKPVSPAVGRIGTIGVAAKRSSQDNRQGFHGSQFGKAGDNFDKSRVSQ